ncbi:MAG: iron-sulfur cluster assembly scaffold protein [Rhodobacteraceae bacterium]|nr:iron-sulfur cluster assembly scaffold protein [Paracoccaceae bacterium]
MESDLIKLYSTRILALAADIPHLGRLDAPEGTACVRSPQCGSSVTVDIALTDGRISAYAQDVKACALGQASAAVVGQNIIGRTRAEVEETRAALAGMLEGGPTPAAPFDELEVLRAAQDFTNRHASILLALDATLAALDDAAAKAA